MFALGHEDGWTGVAAGGSVEVPASSEPQAVTLQLAPFRQFNTKGIEFRYPRSMSWEADHELLVKTWVISGNAAKIMMFQYGAGQHEQLRRDVTTEMLGSYQAAGSASRAPAHLELGGTTYAGERMSVNLVGAALELTLVSFDADGPTILILQDSPEVPGQVTQEMTDLLDLMGSSWKVR